MGIPNLGPKPISGYVTDSGVVKLVLDDGSFLDLPLVLVPGGSIVDNGDNTISITIP